MSPTQFEMDLLEQRRLRLWRRLALPHEPLPPACDFDAEAFTTGYPLDNLLLRAALPVTLAFLFFLLNVVPSSEATNPRGPANSVNVTS